MSALKCLLLLLVFDSSIFVQATDVPAAVVPSKVPAPSKKNELKIEVSLAENDIENLNKSLSDIKATMPTLKISLETIEAAIDALSLRMGVVESSVATLTTSLDDKANEVLNLESLLDNLEQRISAYEEMVQSDPPEQVDEQVEGQVDGESVRFEAEAVKKTYEEYVEYCTEQGGRPADLHTQARIDATITSTTSNYMWVGLRRSPDDGIFYWTSNHSPAQDYLVWLDDHPKDQYDCILVIKEDEVLTFKSSDCADAKNFLCEYDLV